MQVILARLYGFCNGVKQAIKMAETHPGAVIIGGEIIHNPSETQRLADDYQIKIAENPDLVTSNETALIRAHGITMEEESRLRKRGVNVIDVTCPNVKRVQLIVQTMDEKGYQIVLSGDAKHPEVQGIVGYATRPIIVAKTAQELQERTNELQDKIALVSQTTKSEQTLTEMYHFLKAQNKQVKLYNTICSATEEKIKAVQELTSTADIVIIVGGKNSSNCQHLVDVAQNNGVESHLVETPIDLNKKWFKDKKVCGLSAGSSTPNYMFEAVYKALQNIRE